MTNVKPAVFNRACPLLGASFIALGVATASLPFQSTTALSAEQTFGIEEIIITSRKRAESLQKVPIAVSAITANDIQARSINNIADAIRFVPNVNFTASAAAGGSVAQIYIRGVGQSDFAITSDPGVGVYVDGVYLGRSTGSLLDVLDVERVEVLRGPQGTLFGRNTMGGAVSFTSRKPTGELGGYIQGTVGRFSRFDGRASIDVPLVEDRLAAKFSVASLNRDGYQIRLADDVELGEQSVLAGRGVLLWNASEKVEVTLTFDGTRRRDESAPQSLIEVNTTPLLGLYNATIGAMMGVALTDQFVPNDPSISYATGPSVSDMDNWGVSGVIDVDLDGVQLKSITSYRDLEALFARESDASPLPYLEVVNDVDQHQFSQEFQLVGSLFNDRVDILTGAYYFGEKATDFTEARIASGLFALPSPPFPGDLDRFDDNTVNTDSYAAFGEVNINVTPDLRLNLGARYTHEKKTYSITAIRPSSGAIFVGPVEVSDSWSSFTPKASIDFQATDDILLYASYSKGFKSGGFNGRANATTDVTSYDPEKLDNYEIGFKSDLLDRRLRLNVSAFYADYKDLQVNVVVPSGLIFLNTVDNAGKARIKGFEVEAVLRPAEGLTLNGAVGYTDAKYLEVDPTAAFTVDEDLLETPEWTASVGVQYDIPLQDMGVLTLRGDYLYRSRVFHDVQNSLNISQEGYGLLNARASFLTLDEAFEVAVFGTNLTNKTYNLFGINAIQSLGIASVQYARPREWGIEAKFRF